MMKQRSSTQWVLVAVVAVLVIVASVACAPSAPAEEGAVLAGDTPPIPTVTPTPAIPTEPVEEDQAVSVLATPTEDARPATRASRRWLSPVTAKKASRAAALRLSTLTGTPSRSM